MSVSRSCFVTNGVTFHGQMVVFHTTCSRPGLLTLKSGRLSTCSGTRAHPQIGKSCQWWSTLRAMHSSLSVNVRWLFSINFSIEHFTLCVIQICNKFIRYYQINRYNQIKRSSFLSISEKFSFIWSYFNFFSEQSRENKFKLQQNKKS